MWSLEDILQETTDVAELIKAKPNDSVFGEALVKGLCSKVERLQPPLSAGQAVKLLSKAKLLPEGFKDQVTSAVQQQLTSPSVPEQENSCKTQSLLYIHHYLTEKEWVAFESSETTLHQKYSILCWRLKSLGFVSLAECTVRGCMALVISTLASIPDKPTQLSMVSSFKQAFAASPNHVDTVYMRKFPDYPAQLPKEIFQVAYPRDPPCPKEVNNIGSIAAKCHLRKPKGQHVFEPSAGTSSSSRNSHRPMEQGGDMDKFFNMMMYGLQNMHGMHTSNGGHHAHSKQVAVTLCTSPTKSLGNTQPPGASSVAQSAQLLNPHKPAGKSSLLALEAPKEPTPPLTDQHLRTPALPGPEESEDKGKEQPMEADSNEQNNKQPRPSEDYERAAYAALMNRDPSTKKGKGKGRGKGGRGKGKGSKTHMASEDKGAAKKVKRQCLKRPAAKKTSKESFKYFTPPPTKIQLQGRKECYFDLHYHKAKGLALNLGMNYDDALECGRNARQEAVKLWAKA
eukprot:s449_g8.t1